MNFKNLTVDDFKNLCKIYQKKHKLKLSVAQEQLAKTLKFKNFSDAIYQLSKNAPSLETLLKSVPNDFKEGEVDWGQEVGKELLGTSENYPVSAKNNGRGMSVLSEEEWKKLREEEHDYVWASLDHEDFVEQTDQDFDFPKKK